MTQLQAIERVNQINEQIKLNRQEMKHLHQIINSDEYLNRCGIQIHNESIRHEELFMINNVLRKEKRQLNKQYEM